MYFLFIGKHKQEVAQDLRIAGPSASLNRILEHFSKFEPCIMMKAQAKYTVAVDYNHLL